MKLELFSSVRLPKSKDEESSRLCDLVAERLPGGDLALSTV